MSRLGFQLREDLALQLRYSIYEQDITLPSYLAKLCFEVAAPLFLTASFRAALLPSATPKLDSRGYPLSCRH